MQIVKSDRGVGCTRDDACHCHRSMTAASLQCRDGAYAGLSPAQAIFPKDDTSYYDRIVHPRVFLPTHRFAVSSLDIPGSRVLHIQRRPLHSKYREKLTVDLHTNAYIAPPPHTRSTMIRTVCDTRVSTTCFCAPDGVWPQVLLLNGIPTI